MHREYTVEHYLGLLEKLKKSNPQIVLSTDIIVGFVNETEAEFQMTLDLLDRAQYDNIYSYSYSMREKTRAAKMEDLLTNDIRGERLRILQAHQLKIQEKTRRPMEGQKYTVLVEGFGNMGGVKKWKGRTNCNRIVHFKPENDEKDYQWHWVELQVETATALSCQGNLLKDWGRRIPAEAPRY
ncbi:MAG: hypothetical protein COW78_08460 [Bdellovibrio sp. CG22_combo_CG10-13_8_21_14_all_39_27]|nr:MAG: hypothetical protein COW78_08460 [Bdellovibrio sp. CG22_combo_CG10-13_8_21_14_all_39_27]